MQPMSLVQMQQKMNPHACEFIPTLKMDVTEQRKYERQHLVEQITSTKKHLGEQNTSLILLHTELNTDYAVLSYQMNRRENQEFPCYSKEQIDLLHTKYTQQSQYYYKQYSKFNDLTSELLTLQQKLHRLLLSPPLNLTTHTQLHTPPNNHTHNHTHTHTHTHNHNHNHTHAHAHAHTNIISIHPSFTIMDGLSPENNHHSPSSTPCNVLPPIMESDAESSPWNEPIDNIDTPTGSINSNSNTTNNTNNSTAKVQPAKAVENININNINIKKNKSKNLNAPLKLPVTQSQSQTPKAINLKFNANAITHMINSDVEFENKINLMLDTIWNSDIKSISDEFDKFIISTCVDHKSIEILIDCVIRHAVCIGKPVFFGSKYSLLCQSIIMSISKRKINKLNLLELIWGTCYETFRKLQFGNDSDKFINVCIIIAELFNANLVDAVHIFQCIFKDILAQGDINEMDHDDICENDIEGIYEIFKRCHRSLNSRGNKKYLNRYLGILNHVKTWNKFQNGITRVPFMINQMQNTVKNTNRKY